MTEFIPVYDPRSEDYHRAFQVFLAHTDEKRKIHAWLARQIEGLPARNVFIDAGAGTGALTAVFQPRFRTTIAIEPSPALRPELASRCPGVEVIPESILQARPSAPGDLVLCSHVLYYIAVADWLRHLRQLSSWLAPQGILAVLLQSHDCDCTELLWHFTRQRPNLLPLAETFRNTHGDRFTVALERVPASIDLPDFTSAFTVAEFMLNLLPMPQPIPRSEVEAYVRSRFDTGDGRFRMSVDQDFLTIRHRT